ncbi:hypothetical protein [Bombilactobacillus bombi]|uniref:hypothetical protein n=1 Tax=Bombilactobacillus bombi TaxID=1303590 RepID=UPI0015E5F86B|nr:hypothetical protein [Bombilactobacillus bombi]MBA1434553.1 hypothetical protein [Bombilactobacillus bombi]
MSNNYSRPLVNRLGSTDLQELQQARADKYNLVSNLKIATDESTPQQIAHKIIQQLF